MEVATFNPGINVCNVPGFGFSAAWGDERQNDDLVNKCNEHTCKLGSLSFGHVRTITQNNSE